MSNLPLLPEGWPALPLEKVAQLAPVQTLQWRVATECGVTVSVKREDLLHPELGGNKFYKLHGHLCAFRASSLHQILTFGGAYSNHIYATAAAGKALGGRTIGVIRGEKPKKLSPMLVDAQRNGMYLHFVSRAEYRLKTSEHFLAELQSQLGDFYCIPEGGGDEVGAAGCAIWAEGAMLTCKSLSAVSTHTPIPAPIPTSTPTHIALACGTGSSLAGVLSANTGAVVSGFLALKGTDQELAAFKSQTQAMAIALGQKSELSNADQPSFVLESNYHCGGYAKFPAYLREFSDAFTQETGVPLDRVYTAKLFWGIYQKLLAGEYPSGAHILVLHSGGLQGNRS